MALKSTTAPLDAYLLTEWRSQLCSLRGVVYSGLSTTLQTQVDIIVNEAFEYLSQRAGHFPWGQQETTLTITAGSDTTYSMPAAFRNLLEIYEVAADGSRTPGRYAGPNGKQVFFQTQEGSAHPWSTAVEPVWFFDGITSDQPPVQQWRRIGLDNAAATAYVLFRPYFNLLSTSGQDAYPYLPPAEGRALREQMLEDWDAACGNMERSQFHRGRKEDAIAALEKADRQTVDAPLRMRPDADFEAQLS